MSANINHSVVIPLEVGRVRDLSESGTSSVVSVSLADTSVSSASLADTLISSAASDWSLSPLHMILPEECRLSSDLNGSNNVLLLRFNSVQRSTLSKVTFFSPDLRTDFLLNGLLGGSSPETGC